MRENRIRALLLAPDNPEALHVMGQFLIFRGADLPRAVELLRRAVSLQPDHPRFYNSYLEALESAEHQQRLVVGREAAGHCEDRVGDHRDHQGPDPSDAVGLTPAYPLNE